MGPSGSGKTTLLNVLAGQLAASPRLRLSGLLEVNGGPSPNKAYKFAYVRREDLFLSQLTVREALSLAAELQLPEISSSEERLENVNSLLFKLGLASRDGPTNKLRPRMSIASAIIFGSVFWRMGISQTSIQDRMGLLQRHCSFPAMPTLLVFGGYYVNAENTPIIFRWIPRVSLIRWAFQGLCINEFRGLQFDHQHSYDIQNGEQALERISFGGRHIRETIVARSRILLFWYSTTYLFLQKNKPKNQLLEATPLDQIQPAVQLDLLNTEQDEQNEPNEVNEQPVKVEKVELNQPPSESPPIDFFLEGDK